MSEYQLYTLPNGIRIAHKNVPNTKIVHCGIMLDIGSRDERPDQAGLAHFWEHMAFKGTQKRKAYHIINSLEAVGGELNAYTTKEKICFYASVLDSYFEKAVDLLTDITFNSVFPEKQLEVERGVILEEMSMYLDSPEDAIQDEFDTVVFPNHSLGVNILGTTESVKGFKREDFQKFIDENLDTEKIIVSIVGNLDFKKVVRVVEKFLRDIPLKRTSRIRTSPIEYTATKQILEKNNNQAHVAIGRPSFALNHPNRLPFFALVNLLGGPGMNSRFNLSLREKYGLVYQIEAGFTSYYDSGMFAVFFGTDPQNLNKTLKLVDKELLNLKNKSLGFIQLKTLKEQLKGQLAMSEESKQGFMLMMAKSLLDLDKVEPLSKIFSDIDNITNAKLSDLANEMFDANHLSTLIYK
ncbi:insulinase family protein [Lacihabitans sp. LS3-19]|uniref:M16 family metallopeptidase n=1 Tax=Lacihabitans sp. LS3-19 TaxID=2487335 RepID=UPI0020CE1D95|nr:pitrilysin family protein [Lacihabitans sp. LS3-19]MCP9769678.1 insulinase family protein [Lacihabitans sp. LS3-19]